MVASAAATLVAVSGRGADGWLATALCVAACVAAAFPLAETAAADTRYATPDGTGPAASCPESDPCDLEDAVEAPAVSSGDTIIVGSGFYLLADGLEVDDNVSVGGTSSAVPTIVSTTNGEPAVSVDAAGAILHDATLSGLGDDTALDVAHGTAERVTAEGDGAAACAVGVTGSGLSLIRDSVCWSGAVASGASAIELTQAGAGTRSGALRNVTAWTSGSGGTGIDASAGGGGVVSLDARNVIASGTSNDVRASATASSAATLSLTTSNFDAALVSGAGTVTVTSPGTAGNQAAEPQLASPDAGGFAELDGSPTLDAGSSDSLLGSSDLSGSPRTQGPGPDIGARERDGTPPRTTIESGPSTAVSEGKVTFTFSSDDPGATFECRLDDDDYKACASPFTTDSLTQGEHVFQVRGIDEAGNVEPSPASRMFSVDKVIDGANVAAKRTQRPRGKRVSLLVTVRATELARVRAQGTVRVKHRTFSFESRQETLVAGTALKLTLEPAKRQASRKILAALRRGDRVDAVLTATFIDLLGNRATSGNVDVRVKAGRRG